MKKKILTISLFALTFLPSLSFAQNLIACEGLDCTFDSFITTMNNVINYFLAISGLLVAGTIVYIGATILLNPDSESKKTEAKTMMVKTAKGFAYILLSWFVIHVVIGWIVDPSFDPFRFFKK